MPSCFGFCGAGAELAAVAPGAADGGVEGPEELLRGAPPLAAATRGGAVGELFAEAEAEADAVTVGIGASTRGVGAAATDGLAAVGGACASAAGDAARSAPTTSGAAAESGDGRRASHTPALPSAATPTTSPTTVITLPAPFDELNPPPVLPHGAPVRTPRTVSA